LYAALPLRHFACDFSKMNKFVALSLALAFVSPLHAYSACDEYVPTNENPTQDYESTLNNSYAVGTYYFNGSTVNSFKKVVKEHFSGISPPSQIEPGLNLNTCVYNPFPDRDCEYISNDLVMSCGAGYALDNGQCKLTSLEACQAAAEPEICADGFPADAHPAGCDRRDLRECGDGSYVDLEYGVCPVTDSPYDCWNYDSCYTIAFDVHNCPPDATFDFSYINPQNFEASCTGISQDSPDHPDHGGNADGNPYNDPGTPQTGEGSSPSVSDTDPATLASAIDAELQNDFGNIETAIRDSISSNESNTSEITGAISGIEGELSNGFGSLGDKLDTISQQLADTGVCDPSQPDYLSCLDPNGSPTPPHTNAGASSLDEVMSNYKTRIDNAPLSTAFSSMATIIGTGSANCPELSIDLPFPINKNVSTTLHCDLMSTISPIISAVMSIIYAWIGFRIFASS